MSEFGWFIVTIIICGIWVIVGPFLIHCIGYTMDHAGGKLFGMSAKEVNEIREWRERNEQE